MQTFSEWLAVRHPEYESLDESWADLAKKGAMWAGMGAGAFGLGAGSVAGLHYLTKPKVQSAQPAPAARPAAAPVDPDLKGIDPEWDKKVNVNKRVMDPGLIRWYVKKHFKEKYGEEPSRIEIMTTRSYFEKQWGRKWPQVLKKAQDTRVAADMDNLKIPDTENLDAPVVVAHVSKGLLRSKGAAALCSGIGLSMKDGRTFNIKVCMYANEEEDAIKQYGPEEFRHSLQNFGGEAKSSIMPDFPLEKVTNLGGIRDNIEYSLDKHEFWAKVGQLKLAYYRQTGVMPTKGSAKAMIQHLVTRKEEYSGVLQKFASVFEWMQIISLQDRADYYEKIIQMIDDHLDQLVQNNQPQGDVRT